MYLCIRTYMHIRMYVRMYVHEANSVYAYIQCVYLRTCMYIQYCNMCTYMIHMYIRMYVHMLNQLWMSACDLVMRVTFNFQSDFQYTIND